MQFDIIIPAAGCGQRMGSKGPKGLISLGNETVIQRQIRLLNNAYPDSRIIVVGGHKHDKLYKSLSRETSFVLNKDFENTNSAASVRVGLEYTKLEHPALIIYGDLVFNKHTLLQRYAWPKESSVIVDESPLRSDEVGVSENNGLAMHFAFGLPTKWSHIVMLMPKEKKLFMEGCKPPERRGYLSYEILNYVLQNGGRFKLVRPTGMKLVEIDTTKDVPEAVELANEDSVSV